MRIKPFESSFSKNILTLVTGNAIAFVIPVILYPIISRIFAPEDYALFGLYTSIFLVLEIGSAGRYDLAVVLPKRTDKAINIVGGGLIFSLLYALLILLLVIFFRDWVAVNLNNPPLANWLFLLPPALIFTSISKLGNNWLIRQKKFKASSFNKASQKITETSTQMTFGFLQIGNGLIIGDILGRLFNAAMSIYQSVKSGFDRNTWSKFGINMGLRQYAEFPKYNIIPSMLNAIGAMIPVFIISSQYTVKISGSFNFSRILLSIPFALIATGISQVMMQQVSEKKHVNDAILHELISLASKLAIVAMIVAVVLFLGAPEIFEFLFGQEWRQAGDFTRILIFSTTISFLVSPFSNLLAVLGKIKNLGIWQTFYFLGSCCLWLFRGLVIENFLIALVIFDALFYLIYGLLIYSAVKSYERSLKT